MRENFGKDNSLAFTIHDYINEGAFGRVFKGILNTTNEIVAIKEIKIDIESEGIPSTALREICILRELEHQNIVQLKEVICSEMKLYLIMDYLDVDLKKYIDDAGDKYLDPNEVQIIIYQLLQGLLFCHNKKIIHRDLKPQNILVNKVNGLIKIADFGLARVFAIPIRPYTKEVITLWYRSPEILMGIEEYTECVDLWSVGCIFAELVTKQPLFPGENEVEQLKKIFKILGTPNSTIYPGIDNLPGYSKDSEKYERKDLHAMFFRLLNKDGIDLLTKLLVYDPQQRITASDALQHPFFKNLM